MVLASALMLSEGASRAVNAGGQPDVAVVMRAGSTGELESGVDEAAVGLVLSQPGVAQEAGKPLGTGELMMVLSLDKVDAVGFANVNIRGVTEASLALRPNLKVVEGRLPKPGTDEGMVGRAIVGRFKGLELGQPVDVRKNRPLRIVGVFEDNGSSAESEIWGDLDTLRSAFGRQGGVSAVRVRLTSPSQQEAFAAVVSADKRLNLKAKPEPEFLFDQSEGLSKFITIMGLVISIFFSAGAIVGATITMHAAVAHRTREIGTLRALGFSRGAILMGFLLESLVMALAGGALGVVGAVAISNLRVSMMNPATFSELVFSFAPSPPIFAAAAAFAIGMGVAGGFLPAWRASRISPLAALRS
jgi:putative ABC transport system permease protein